MAIPGITNLSGQPTLTNPLNQQGLLEGRTLRVQQGSETQSTVTAQEQPATQTQTTQVVNQAEEARESNPAADDRSGSKIDIMA